MSTPHAKKQNHQARTPRWRRVADSLNELAFWENLFSVEPPLEMMDAGGFPRLRVNTLTGTLFAHPWRVTLDGAGEHATVAGGHVDTGSARVTVAGLAAADLVDGRKWWLQVKYYNNPATAAEYAVQAGTAFPAASYAADTLPVPGSEESLPQAGWCIAILPIGEYSTAGGLVQWLFEDVWLPYGRTYAVARLIGQRWDGATLELIRMTETYVRGVLTSAAAPEAVAVLGYEPCPQP